ncbi:8-oxoguanine DNA glycosylase OGG fold protein [Dyadobacter tibetensis]|uniref:8-oxoguanine DNA glycosylase OGG fold protein n=1 Tax=Dyadobacter tibetensis TaxID=1211851 RepID=UPI00046ED52F|nr:hypothetical protein [Dyadobacter tibetensis]
MDNPSIPKYLLENHDRIINAPVQQITLWNASYDRYKGYEVVNEIYKRFPNRNLQRKEVINLFSENPYTGFIASLMWGGINANRPQTAEGMDTPFRKILEHPIEKVEQAIQYAEQKIKSGEMYDLFLSFAPNGDHDLPGIGYAYYTKLFFFLGQLHDVSLKPLILDKWTSNAHCSLTIQTAQIHRLAYKGINTNLAYAVKLPSSLQKQAALYNQYVVDFNTWTKKLNELNKEQQVTPAKVEEFVFGQSLKLNPDPSNPRKQLWKIIVDHFGGDNFLVEIKTPRIAVPRTIPNIVAIEPLTANKKYYYLQEYLRECSLKGLKSIVLTIHEIEIQLSRDTTNKLPTWAFTRSALFWGNTSSEYHVQKVAWLSQGYRVSRVDISSENKAGAITFTKMD